MYFEVAPIWVGGKGESRLTPRVFCMIYLGAQWYFTENKERWSKREVSRSTSLEFSFRRVKSEILLDRQGEWSIS